MIRLSDILKEGIKEIDELERLAEACIRLIISQNTQRIPPVFKRRLDNPKEPHDKFIEIIRKNFFFSDPVIEMKDAGKGGYDVIKDFIKEFPVLIEFSDTPGTNGVYVGRKSGGHIYIKLDRKDFAQDFAYQVDITTHRAKMPSEKEMRHALEIAMGANMRTTLLHELQHAYDDWRSKGKYTQNKRYGDYRKTYSTDVLSGGDVTFDPEHWAKYAQLPHEYWARFSQTVRDIFAFSGMYKKPFTDIQKRFVDKFPGYKEVTDDDRKRLLKALYKYWDENKDKVK